MFAYPLAEQATMQRCRYLDHLKSFKKCIENPEIGEVRRMSLCGFGRCDRLSDSVLESGIGGNRCGKLPSRLGVKLWSSTKL